MDRNPEDVTGLLVAWGDGEKEALDRLMPLVYDELRRLAHAHLRRERADATIATTALVNEAYLRLVDQKRARLVSRNHFFSLAAQIMRRVIVDEARRRGASKRGSSHIPIALDEAPEPFVHVDDKLVELDEALTALEKVDARLSRLVELRYFGGLSLDEAADLLDVSRSTAARNWQAARAWLFQALSDSAGHSPPDKEER